MSNPHIVIKLTINKLDTAFCFFVFIAVVIKIIQIVIEQVSRLSVIPILINISEISRSCNTQFLIHFIGSQLIAF